MNLEIRMGPFICEKNQKSILSLVEKIPEHISKEQLQCHIQALSNISLPLKKEKKNPLWYICLCISFGVSFIPSGENALLTRHKQELNLPLTILHV